MHAKMTLMHWKESCIFSKMLARNSSQNTNSARDRSGPASQLHKWVKNASLVEPAHSKHPWNKPGPGVKIYQQILDNAASALEFAVPQDTQVFRVSSMTITHDRHRRKAWSWYTGTQYFLELVILSSVFVKPQILRFQLFCGQMK